MNPVRRFVRSGITIKQNAHTAERLKSASSNGMSRSATGAATGAATFAATVPTKRNITRLKTAVD